jgi:hypothetical protein
MLNNVQHKDLKIITRHTAEFGVNVHAVPTFPTEYGDVQREYPIFFRKDADTGEFQSIALLGFEQGENLFLDDAGWHASYVPAIVERGPFLIGFQNQELDGDSRREPVIHIDMDSPRVSETEGQPVFRQHGGNTPYIDRIANILRGIQDGISVSKDMFAAFESYDLIEAINIELAFHTDELSTLRGLYSISQRKLTALDGEALEALNKGGYLLGAFLVVTSLNNVKKMIEMKNQRRLQ